MKKIFLALLFLPFFSACFIYNYAHYRKRDIKTTAEPISHAIWDTLLQKNVDTLGNVDYKAFIKVMTCMLNVIVSNIQKHVGHSLRRPSHIFIKFEY